MVRGMTIPRPVIMPAVIAALGAVAEAAAAVGALLIVLNVVLSSVGHVLDMIYKIKGRR